MASWIPRCHAVHEILQLITTTAQLSVIINRAMKYSRCFYVYLRNERQVSAACHSTKIEPEESIVAGVVNSTTDVAHKFEREVKKNRQKFPKKLHVFS